VEYKSVAILTEDKQWTQFEQLQRDAEIQNQE
jgi:hypothetical protein